MHIDLIWTFTINTQNFSLLLTLKSLSYESNRLTRWSAGQSMGWSLGQ